MKKRHYTLSKKDIYDIAVFKHGVAGYKVKPKDTVKNDVMSVNRMILVKPDFIQNILKKKIKRRLEMYVEYIIKIIESVDDTDSDKTAKALDDLERYRTMIQNNYRIYLEKKYIDLLLKKIEVLEKELKKKKLMQLQQERLKKEKELSKVMIEEEKELVEEKSRKSR